MIDVSKAHEISKEGLAISDENGNVIAYLATGTGDPTGSAAPINTWFLRQDTQTLFYKFGSGNNDWRQIRAADIQATVAAGTPPGANVQERLDNIAAEFVPFSVAALTTNSPDLVGLTQTLAVVSAIANRHFGKFFQPAFTAADLTTTSTTFLDIQTITTPSLPSGNYLAIGYASYQKTLLAGQIQTRIFLNNTTEFALGQVPMDDDDFWFQSTILAYLPGLSGVNTIDLQMRKSSGGGDILTQNRTLLFLRVS